MATGIIPMPANGRQSGVLTLSSKCSARGITYVVRVGNMLMVHLSVKTTSAFSSGDNIAAFPSGLPTNHVGVDNFLCISDAGTSYTININSGVIKASASIPTNVQLIADIPLYIG